MASTGKWVPRRREPAPPPPRGVHFPSDRTGEPAQNERRHFFNPAPRQGSHGLTRVEKAAAESRRLARRTVRAKPLKGALKGKTHRKRHARSHSPTRKTAKNKRAHSR